MRRSTLPRVTALLLTVAVAAGCGGATDPDGSGGAVAGGRSTTGTFAPYPDGADAVTYDPDLVPAGAVAIVVVSPDSDETDVELAVTGLLPDRGYGAHLHTKPCGATGDDAGPHHQHVPDPAASVSPPSVDPSYANPRNEVWLDFTTDGAGAASTRSTLPWRSGADRRPRSLVIHAQTTKTGAGQAGTAGARLACLTLS
jgi:Cu-Zn family superoxide dismutase